MAYIKVAFSHECPIKFVPIEQDGKISMETFNSIFPRAHGMFYEHKSNQYVITLINGRLHPPPDGWKNSVFYPLFGDEDHYEDDDDYEEDDYYGDDDYYEDDHYEDDRKNNVYGKPPIKEDINELFYNVLNGKNNDDDDDDNYDDDDYDDDE